MWYVEYLIPYNIATYISENRIIAEIKSKLLISRNLFLAITDFATGNM